ncbi:MAG: hypothetical protein U0414_34315 [Polyangiaceae bacterium]
MKKEPRTVFARRLRAVLVGFALTGLAGLAATSTAACGNIVADRCDKVCACENCGDRDRQECDTKAEASYAIADAYGCTSLLELYWECEVQESDCTDHHYSDDQKQCDHEHTEYTECLDKGSSLAQPYQGPEQ